MHGGLIAAGYRIESAFAFHFAASRRHPAAMHSTHGQEFPMIRLARHYSSLAFVAVLALSVSHARADNDDGIVRVKSAVPMQEAIVRIKADIAAKGIKFFSEINQSKLAADADIKLRPSTLLVFGNPPLGTQFITSNPNAGLDWPVRLLLTQDDNGDVWAVWTDFEWIARRHNIRDRVAQFKMATTVVNSITSTITSK
jgi:uncharacterized protein (DUF302 family)